MKPDGCGQSAMTSDSPPVSVFHSVSVTNGITGCSSFSSVSSTAASTAVVCVDPFRQLHLGQLDVPVAELVPGEVVERLAGPAELVAVERRIHLGANLFQPAEDPAVGVGELVGVGQRRRAGAVHQREPGGVEQLGGEVARRAGVVLADGQVAAGAGAAGQGEPQRVGAELLHPVQRIDAVAARLAHLAAELVADQPVQEDVLERHLRPALPVER